MPTMMDRITKNSDLALAIGLVSILAVMILPVPAFLIDFFLVLGIAISIILLLTSVYTHRALDFSVFPSLLLITTLFRLSINVATTRLILINGADGVGAAGHVIEAFGNFVVGGNYAVGVVVFTILVIINFIVITKGAGRVAEVSARFTLDAMPGKQMAIDADLNAGVINEEAARARRSDIAREADFYGAMDGASKFVRGDAIAGILIVVVNSIGGVLIGVLQKGMEFSKAIETFVLLTIGDGLVSQIPALLISTAAGIIVTRSAGGTNLGQELSKQLVTQPKALMVSTGLLFFLGLVPGLPLVPFWGLAGIIGFVAYQLNQSVLVKAAADKKKIEDEKLKPKAEKLEGLLPLDTLELEVGYGLISIVDADQNGDLLERITNIRKQFALDLGIIVPSIRIRDNLELKPGDYQVLLKGVAIGSGNLMIGHLLAMDPGNVADRVPGIPTKEPAFGLDAIWISPRQKDDAIMAGYTVVDMATVIATHITEIIRSHSSELLGRQELQTLLDNVKVAAPKVVEDLIPNLLPTGSVLKILKALLREGVSIRDLKSILEVLADASMTTKDTQLLAEHVRSALGRSITKKYVGSDGKLTILTLDRSIEEVIASAIIHTDQGQQLSLDPEFVRQFIAKLNDQVMEMASQASHVILLCSPVIRPHLKGLVDKFIPNVIVLSHNEITPNVAVKSFGTVRMAYAS